MQISKKPLKASADVAQSVEHRLGKAEVTGPIPVISSTNKKSKIILGLFCCKIILQQSCCATFVCGVETAASCSRKYSQSSCFLAHFLVVISSILVLCFSRHQLVLPVCKWSWDSFVGLSQMSALQPLG